MNGDEAYEDGYDLVHLLDEVAFAARNMLSLAENLLERFRPLAELDDEERFPEETDVLGLLGAISRGTPDVVPAEWAA